MEQFVTLIAKLDPLEAVGVLTGLLAVWLLIRQNVWTWPVGILSVVISFYIFWQAKLYADLVLQGVYLVLFSYGWWYWLRGGPPSEIGPLPVTTTPAPTLTLIALLALSGTVVSGFLLRRYTDASVPYWDSATTVFSFAGMWLSARKKIEHWICWFVVDVIATGVYLFKSLPLFTLLYLIYVGMAVYGWLNWRPALKRERGETASSPA